MKISNNIKNWQIGNHKEVLNCIHYEDVNIVIYDRGISVLKEEISQLLYENVEFKASGSIDAVFNALNQSPYLKKASKLVVDIKEQLLYFQKVSESNGFKLLLATVDSNMCSRFHTDINDLRLLCTYSGPGTLWLTEDNVNREALYSNAGNNIIIYNEENIQQVQTGSIAILKGAIYSDEGAIGVVHRSPTIEESSMKRLLLRIDTNAVQNFWT